MKRPSKRAAADLSRIRELIIVSMFSDDVLLDKLVLKGGNALSLIHGLAGRTSLDVDLSIDGDFDDVEEVRARIFAALDDRFGSAGFTVFDHEFTRKPEKESLGQNPKWGGYVVEFKVIEQPEFDRIRRQNFGSSDEREHALRMGAIAFGPKHNRKFKVDLSKFEFCESKMSAELDDYTIYVYTLPMVAVEKLRAICQQLPQYKLRGYATPRARDFYDIYRIVNDRGIDLTSPENLELIRAIFAAKEVPLDSLGLIPTQREFHRPDWDAVLLSATESLQNYDYYFDFVAQLVDRLQAAGIK